MSKIKDSKGKLKLKIETIKKVNDNPKSFVDNTYNKYLKDISNLDNKVNSFQNKIGQNNTNIFEDLLDISNSFIINKSKGSPNSVYNLAVESMNTTLKQLPTVFSNNVKKAFLSSNGYCGINNNITLNTIELSPKEFDFFDILKISPTSQSGKIIYEPILSNSKTRLNTELYNTFNKDFNFHYNNVNIFNVSWNKEKQKYLFTNISNLNENELNISEFFSRYYSSIDFPNLEHIIKNTLYSIVQKGEEKIYINNINISNRVLNRIFKFCNDKNVGKISDETNEKLFNENEEDLNQIFEYDDIYDIDINEEYNRLNGIINLIDCDNFKLDVPLDIYEDFIYFNDKENVNDLLQNTFDKLAKSTTLNNLSEFPDINIKIGLLNRFILELPKTLLNSIITPKFVLPIIMVYKTFNNISEIVSAKDFFKTLKNLIYSVFKELYYLFINEFWLLLKPEILNFVKIITKNILLNKLKRYRLMIKSLLDLIKRVKIKKISNCGDLFNNLNTIIDELLKNNKALRIPNLVLAFADLGNGFSTDRAVLNIFERLESSGISLEPLYGDDNDLIPFIKSIIEGYSEELDENSFVKVTNKFVTLASPIGPIPIPPGTLSSSGKLF